MTSSDSVNESSDLIGQADTIRPIISLVTAASGFLLRPAQKDFEMAKNVAVFCQIWRVPTYQMVVIRAGHVNQGNKAHNDSLGCTFVVFWRVECAFLWPTFCKIFANRFSDLRRASPSSAPLAERTDGPLVLHKLFVLFTIQFQLKYLGKKNKSKKKSSDSQM